MSELLTKETPGKETLETLAAGMNADNYRERFPRFINKLLQPKLRLVFIEDATWNETGCKVTWAFVDQMEEADWKTEILALEDLKAFGEEQGYCDGEDNTCHFGEHVHAEFKIPFERVLDDCERELIKHFIEKREGLR